MMIEKSYPEPDQQCRKEDGIVGNLAARLKS